MKKRDKQLPKKKSKKRMIFLGVLILLILVLVLYVCVKFFLKENKTLYAPGDTITRVFSRTDAYVNEEIQVNLNLDIVNLNVEKVAVLSEILPSNVALVSSGPEINYNEASHTLRWVIENLNGLTDTSVSYIVKPLSSGQHVFSGTYVFETESPQEVRAIGGNTFISASSCTLSGNPLGTEKCDGLDNNCDHALDEGGNTLCSLVQGSLLQCQGVSGCVCTSTGKVKDLTANGGNCNGICEDSESTLIKDKTGNCNGICEETPYVLDNPANADNSNSGNCNGCVSADEIRKYKDKFLSGGLGSSSETMFLVANEAGKWLRSIGSC